MNGEVLDLDILRPSPLIVKIGGEEIDLSFIPCGITFDVDRISREIMQLDTKEIAEGGEDSRKAFDLAIDLCATFCSLKHPKMTIAWFMENTDPVQINKLADTIKATLQRSFEGVEAYQKN